MAIEAHTVVYPRVGLRCPPAGVAAAAVTTPVVVLVDGHDEVKLVAEHHPHVRYGKALYDYTRYGIR